ncbi:MAG: alpha/beta hydrolase [Chitinophagaceae bacterium]|nr:alpha/beta hydrolase [Chitinophagaceae bacterium]
MTKEIIFKDKRIYYKTSGNGKPVMLLHGFGEDGDIWQKQAEFLAINYKVIVPDLPGSGNSELADDMSIEGMAEVVKTILEKEALAPCPVIGHSMGGYITLALAEKYPQLLSAFGLFHSTSYDDSEEKKATRRKAIEFIYNHGSYEFLKTAIPNLFASASGTTMSAVIAALIEKGKKIRKEALITYYEAMIARPDRTTVLRNATVPVLFVIGEYDGAVPPADSLQQSHLSPIADVHILSDAGHMGMLEEVERTNHLMERFLNFVAERTESFS